MSAIRWPSNAANGPSSHALTLLRPAAPAMPLVATSALERRAATGARTRLWELAPNFHCSIIGTCLSSGGLRNLLVKLKLCGPEIDDHTAHKIAVTIASRHDVTGKLLNKALDDSHRLAINRFAKLGSEENVRNAWKQALESGDIPGAYWAVVTHPLASRDLLSEAFGEVHMLSHLVGAANRAEIRRLRELESANTQLEEKLARQQAQLRTAITERDAEIRALRDALAQRAVEQYVARPIAGPQFSDALIADQQRRLTREAARREAVEEKLAVARRELEAASRERDAGARREAALGEELAAMEALLAGASEASQATGSDAAKWTILYVGGRPAVLAALRNVAEHRGVELLHHDGGVEDNTSILAGLAGRSDAVVFPVDCISHAAVIVVKQLCRQMEKPFIALRSASVSAFAAAVAAH